MSLNRCQQFKLLKEEGQVGWERRICVCEWQFLCLRFEMKKMVDHSYNMRFWEMCDSGSNNKGQFCIFLDK
jgi:hypothetical protein